MTNAPRVAFGRTADLYHVKADWPHQDTRGHPIIYTDNLDSGNTFFRISRNRRFAVLWVETGSVAGQRQRSLFGVRLLQHGVQQSITARLKMPLSQITVGKLDCTHGKQVVLSAHDFSAGCPLIGAKWCSALLDTLCFINAASGAGKRCQGSVTF